MAQRPENEQQAKRFLGLSPKARQAMLWLLLLTMIAVPLAYGLGRASGETPPQGGDLTILAAGHDHLLVGGEWGVAQQTVRGWRPVDALSGRDVMAWGVTSNRLLAGAHDGLYVSTDDGRTFSSIEGVPTRDVHGVGAAGHTVYVTAPDGSVYVSENGGAAFNKTGRVGTSFMGTIWVNPRRPDVAIAPSMQGGAMRTTDRGASWTPLGGPGDAMAVAVDPGGDRIVVIGMHGAQISQDKGATWSALDVPPGTITASYDHAGSLLVAGWHGDQVVVMRQNGLSWANLGTPPTA